MTEAAKRVTIGEFAARRRVWWPFLAFFCAFATPFCNAVLSLRIPLWRTEPAVILALLAVIALLAAFATLRLPRLLQALVYAVTVLCFIDLAYGGNNLATSASVLLQWLAGERGGRLLAVAASLAVACAVMYRLGRNAPTLVGAVLGAMLLSTVVLHSLSGPALDDGEQLRARPGGAAAPAAGSPVVVVLLLDELMAVGAMPEAGVPAELAALRKRIFDFHAKHGFRLHTRAYSRHFWTQDSIPDLLNFDYSRTSKTPLYTAAPDARHNAIRVVENRLFREFAGRGYAIEVFQTDHIHYCGGPGVSFCATLDSFNPLSNLTTTTAVERHGIVAGAALRAIADSYVVNTLLSNSVFLRDLVQASPSRIDVQAFRPWFAAIKQRVLASSPGTLIFAHVMVPHSPYMLNEDCSVTVNWTNPYRLAEGPGGAREVEAAYRRNYRRYYQQVACLYSELEDLFGKVAAQPALKDAIFIITGDHGSRISKTQFAGSMDRRDILDNYAAHFAVRAPAAVPGVDPAAVALQRLFAEAFDPAQKSTRFTEAERSVLAEVKGENRFALIRFPGFEPAAP